MNAYLNSQMIFRKVIALPQDHGSWVFLLSPLLIGLFASARWAPATGLLIVAAFTAFLLRQPVTIAVKALSGRRSRRDLASALLWSLFYGSIGLVALIGLVLQEFGYLLILALPGLPVFAWHLVLVSRRSERRQMAVEMVGSGVLALAAPAAYWVGLGKPDPLGWWLFGLAWLQSSASIVYAYLRLEQRPLRQLPDLTSRLRMGWRAILYTTFNLVLVSALSLFKVLPAFLFLPFALQWAECLYGALARPAINVRPAMIGGRQAIVSSLFTILFILTWKI